MAERLRTEQMPEAGPNAGVVTLWLEQPGRPVVVLDEPLLQSLAATLDELPESMTGFVLASASPKVFVAGADLKSIVDRSDDELHDYLKFGAEVFGRIGQLPCPTAAAINGAALGGGLEIAMHCDALIAAPGAKPYPVGLPEAGLSICPGWGGTNLLPARIDPADAMARTASGTPMKFDDAVAAGMFDAVADSADSLLDTARRWVASAQTPERDGAPSRWIGRHAGRVSPAISEIEQELQQTEPGAAVANAVHAGLADGWQAALESERQSLVRLRHTEPAKAAIEAFFARSAPKPA